MLSRSNNPRSEGTSGILYTWLEKHRARDEERQRKIQEDLGEATAAADFTCSVINQ